jgi:hypothetical protein
LATRAHTVGPEGQEQQPQGARSEGQPLGEPEPVRIGAQHHEVEATAPGADAVADEREAQLPQPGLVGGHRAGEGPGIAAAVEVGLFVAVGGAQHPDPDGLAFLPVHRHEWQQGVPGVCAALLPREAHALLPEHAAADPCGHGVAMLASGVLPYSHGAELLAVGEAQPLEGAPPQDQRRDRGQHRRHEGHQVADAGAHHAVAEVQGQQQVRDQREGHADVPGPVAGDQPAPRRQQGERGQDDRGPAKGT